VARKAGLRWRRQGAAPAAGGDLESAPFPVCTLFLEPITKNPPGPPEAAEAGGQSTGSAWTGQFWRTLSCAVPFLTFVECTPNTTQLGAHNRGFVSIDTRSSLVTAYLLMGVNLAVLVLRMPFCIPTMVLYLLAKVRTDHHRYLQLLIGLDGKENWVGLAWAPRVVYHGPFPQMSETCRSLLLSATRFCPWLTYPLFPFLRSVSGQNNATSVVRYPDWAQRSAWRAQLGEPHATNVLAAMPFLASTMNNPTVPIGLRVPQSSDVVGAALR